MTYDLLLAGDLDVPRLTAALAAVAAVPAGAVDVAPADVEDRNWDATVLCTYRPVDGDIRWSLDIYLAATASPSEAEAAESLAASLGLPVLYSTELNRPSAYWMALPDGSRTRARVYEDETSLLIDAVAKPVAWLPTVRVEAQPEVIREYRMPTPITDGLRAWLAAELLPPDQVEPALDQLGGWEAMTVRMTTGWPPDGWYPAAYFEEDLQNRDDLADATGRVPPEATGHFAEALARVDAAYRTATQEVKAAPEGRSWWWGRLPDPVPWSPTTSG